MRTIIPLSKVGRFGTLYKTHPFVGRRCTLCHTRILTGDVPALIETPYAGGVVEATPVHEQCMILAMFR